MKNMKVSIISFISLVCILVFADYSPKYEINVKNSEISIINRGGYDFIRIENCTYSTEPGMPQIPILKESYIIADGFEVESIEIISAEIDTIKGFYNIFPVQKPKPMNSEFSNRDFTLPDKNIYEKDMLIPDLIIKLDKECEISGMKIALISFSPLLCNPLKGIITVVKSVSFRFKLKESSKQTNHHFNEIDIKNVKDIVSNPDEIYKLPKSVYDTLIEYVIIIDTSNINGENHPEIYYAFDDFVFWKNKIGIPTKIYTLDFIEYNYQNSEITDKIKTFITDMHNKFSTKYILFVGEDDADEDDISVIYNESDVGGWMPRKDIFFFDASSDGLSDDDSIISDYWYGDLNNDNMPDVSTGRILFNEYDNAYRACSLFVHRTITYEKIPPYRYLGKMLLTSEELFENYYGKSISESLANNNPTDMTDIKYYDEDMNYDDITTLNEINNGIGIYHSASHGSIYGHMLSSGDGITSDDLDALMNVDDKFYVFFGFPCFLGAYDYDSYAEHLMTNLNTGAVASFMNTRYGFADIEYPGQSESQSLLLLKAFSQEGYYRLGDAKKRMNEIAAMYASTDQYAKFCLFEYTLFGDPTLDIHTKELSSLSVIHPDTIKTSEYISVLVCEDNGYEPISDALITLWGKKEKGLYIRNYSDLGGGALFYVNPEEAFDTIYVTVVKHNRRIYEGTIIVMLDGPSKPILYAPFDNVKTTSAKPVLKFRSSDALKRDIKYTISMDTNPSFENPTIFETPFFASNVIASFALPDYLINGSVHYWKIIAVNSDGYTSDESHINSFTVNNDIPFGSYSWFKSDSNQFIYDSLYGTVVTDAGVSIGRSNILIYELWMNEDFESNFIPANWTVIDGNNDGYKFKSGPSGQKSLLGYDPPNPGAFYIYYADSDVRSTNTKADENFITPSLYSAKCESLKMYFSYGFKSLRTGEFFTFEVYTLTNGSWNSGTVVHSFAQNSSGNMNIDITEYLPCDSIKFAYHYSNTEKRGGAVAVDNVGISIKRFPEFMNGTVKTEPIAFSDFLSIYNKSNWGITSISKSLPSDSVTVSVEYLSNGNWKKVENSLIPNNSVGISSVYSEIKIDMTPLSPSYYDTLRIVSSLFRENIKMLSDPVIKSCEVGIDKTINTHSFSVEIMCVCGINSVELNLMTYEGFDLLNLLRTDEYGKTKRVKSFCEISAGSYIYKDKDVSCGAVYEYSAEYLKDGKMHSGGNIIVKTPLSSLSLMSIQADFGSNTISIASKSNINKLLKIELYDISGNMVMEKKFKMNGRHTRIYIPSNISSGIYFAFLRDDFNLKTYKFSIIK